MNAMEWCKACRSLQPMQELLRVRNLETGEVFHACRPSESGTCFGMVVGSAAEHRIELADGDIRSRPEAVQSPADARLAGARGAGIAIPPRGSGSTRRRSIVTRYEEAQAEAARRRLGSAAERGVPPKQGLDGFERRQAAQAGISRGYASSLGVTRAERRQRSIASTFQPDPQMEQLERQLAANPDRPVSPVLRMTLGHYRAARAAHEKENHR
jgi:hypothetical protein